ncbi:MAG: hypothetical protein ACRC0F_10965, partial [Cetobacterium sp.]
KEMEITHTIKWDSSKKYFNLSDFCRNTRGMLFIKESELKQYFESCGYLTKNALGKYVVNNDETMELDGEIYVSHSILRRIMTIRGLICIGEDSDIDEMVSSFKNNKNLLVEQMANTVYVQCKQKSEEFKLHRENVHYMQVTNK